MQQEIKAGTILVREGTLFPPALTFGSEAYSPGWRSVQGLDGYAMDRKTHDAGWTFFYLAGERRATAFGREGQETLRKVIKKILGGLKSEKSNSLEITHVEFKHFLGMPCATVCFHMRNMQEGMFLLGGDGAAPWKAAPLVAA